MRPGAKLALLPAVTLVLALAGCDTTLTVAVVSKEAAAAAGGRGPDGTDLCELNGWYVDQPHSSSSSSCASVNRAGAAAW